MSVGQRDMASGVRGILIGSLVSALMWAAGLAVIAIW